MPHGPRFSAVVVILVALVGSALRAQRVTHDTSATMSRVAAYVEQYYSRAQSIVAQETVIVQNVLRDLSSDGFPQRYVYNLRVEWTPSGSGPPDAHLTRELVSVNGRTPREGDEPHCTAPKPITPEPLAMFLRERQADFLFSNPEGASADGRPLLRFDYRLRSPGPDMIEWDRECVTMDFPSRMRGRVWIEDDSGEVVRIDEGSVGPVEVEAPRAQRRRGLAQTVVFDRWSESIRYKPVTFHDPEETLLLPASIESVSMARTYGTRRTQTYTNYRRFVTEGRIVE